MLYVIKIHTEITLVNVKCWKKEEQNCITNCDKTNKIVTSHKCKILQNTIA